MATYLDWNEEDEVEEEVGEGGGEGDGRDKLQVAIAQMLPGKPLGSHIKEGNMRRMMRKKLINVQDS